MIEIYVDEITERAVYTFDFVLSQNGVAYKFNNDFKSFEKSTHSKLNYSERPFENILQLVPSTLLFEESIRKYSLSKGYFSGEECLILDTTCDPFASIFFVLSRLEEYGDILHDEHDRFPAKQSILHQFGWLQRMVCERWSKAIMDYLTENKLMTVALKKRAIELVPTFDIDNAFAYKWKEGSRQILATAKDYLKRDKTRINERKQVLAGKIKDPYDTFETIKTIGENFKNTVVFWLLADYANFDKNIFHADQRQIELIKELNKSCEVGIHPSYNSNTKSGQQQIEIRRLTNILERKTLISRQHFLKFRLPKTYNELIENGIEHDYSMGYASEVGFRAGTSRPFLWFDIQKNRTTPLWIHPFAYMDGTLLEYKKFTIEEAKVIIESLYQEFQQFGGEFIFLWHNETIGDYAKWKGWSEVLDFTLKLNE